MAAAAQAGGRAGAVVAVTDNSQFVGYTEATHFDGLSPTRRSAMDLRFRFPTSAGRAFLVKLACRAVTERWPTSRELSPTCQFLAKVTSKCFARVCPFQIGYDVGFTPGICDESNFLFTGDPELIAKIPKVITRRTKTPSQSFQCGV